MLRSRSARLVAVALLVTLSASTSGCYNTVSVRPDQIPRLSGMPSPQVLAYSRDTTVIAEARTTVITADGTTAEVRGQPELTLTLTDGRVLSFEPPMQGSLLSPDELLIAGSNIPELRVRFDQIRGASARYQDLGMTMFAVVVLGLALSVVFAGGIYLLLD